MAEQLEELISLTPIQIKYLDDLKHRFLIVSAGRRSRKTLIGRRKILIAAFTKPNTRYFHAAPTHKQAKEIFWDNLKRDVRGITRKVSETELRVILGNNSEIVVVGLDVPERIEGQTPSFNGCHITEFPNLKENAFTQHVYPALSDEKGFGIFDGVPEGRNHYYDLALKACNNAIPQTKPQYGAFAENGEWCFYTWFSSDVLDPAIIEQAKLDLDERTFKQEYEGQFVDFAGLAYYAFGSHNLRNCYYEKDYRVCIGMDFNVNPMTAVIGHIVSDVFYQFDELYLTNSNTYEMVEALKEKFNPGVCDIYPDSTGKARESNATESDLDILQKAGFNIFANSENPRVIDRVNCVNSRMKIIDGNKSRYYVNPKTCPKTVNDCNKVTRLEDGRLDKKLEERGLKHITDALGYLLHYNFPLKESIEFLN